LKTVLPNGDFEGCIDTHMSGWEEKHRQPINNLSTEEFARCYYVGYELQETPEEKILRKFNYMSAEGWDNYIDGMLYVLDELNIKIKGIK